MAIDTMLKKRKVKIDSKMRQFLPKELNLAQMEKICGKAKYEYDLKSAKQSIHMPIWELLDRGGKRWRPALFLIIAKAFGAKEEKLLDLSIIPEIVHNGTLMIDDIEDNSDLRRGKSAIHKIHGNDIAINAGTAMYYLPLIALKQHKSDFSPKTINAAYEIYAQEMINLAYGQGFDIYWHKGGKTDVTEGMYLQMCAFKTGTLARMAAKLGALFAGANQKQIDLAGEFAESIGIAFQIQDDILNLVGTKEYGKEIGGDISEGKRTLIIIRAFSKLAPNQGRRLIEILNSHTKNQLIIGEAISLIRGTDALEYCSNRARKLVKDAWKKFSFVLKDSPAKAELKEFADYLIERDV